MVSKVLRSFASCTVFCFLAGLFMVVLVQTLTAPKPNAIYLPSTLTFVGHYQR